MRLYTEFENDQICDTLECDNFCGVPAYAMSDFAVCRRGTREDDGCDRLFK
jgi:hypothetical protein